MKNSFCKIAALAAVLFIGFTVSADEPKTIMERHYKSEKGAKRDLTRSVKAVRTGDVIEITENVVVKARGKTAGYETVVKYREKGGSFTLVEASGRTFFGNETVTEGEVVFHGDSYDVKSTSYMNQRAKKLEKPEKTDKKGVALKKGIQLTSAAFEVLGPMILGNGGKIEGIVFVEIPDDIGYPDFMEVESKEFHLVKKEAEDGYEIKMVKYIKYPDEEIEHVELGISFDKKGEVTRYDFRDNTLVPGKKEEKPKKTGEKTPGVKKSKIRVIVE